MTEVFDLQDKKHLLQFLIEDLLPNAIPFEMDFDGEKLVLYFPGLPRDWIWLEGGVG